MPAAILFDLGFGGDWKIRPTADCGYKAAAAANEGPCAEGNVGAGAGATVGKMGGPANPTKGGLGSAAITMPNGLVVAALVAVNAVGDVIDPTTGQVVAGVRTADGKTFADARTAPPLRRVLRRAAPRAGENTTIGIVATNAKLTKVQAQKIAQMAHDGYARAISPVHTPGDGDTIFSLATGAWDGEAEPHHRSARSPPRPWPMRSCGPRPRARAWPVCRPRASSARCRRASNGQPTARTGEPSCADPCWPARRALGARPLALPRSRTGDHSVRRRIVPHLPQRRRGRRWRARTAR